MALVGAASALSLCVCRQSSRQVCQRHNDGRIFTSSLKMNLWTIFTAAILAPTVSGLCREPDQLPIDVCVIFYTVRNVARSITITYGQPRQYSFNS